MVQLASLVVHADLLWSLALLARWLTFHRQQLINWNKTKIKLAWPDLSLLWMLVLNVGNKRGLRVKASLTSNALKNWLHLRASDFPWLVRWLISLILHWRRSLTTITSESWILRHIHSLWSWSSGHSLLLHLVFVLINFIVLHHLSLLLRATSSKTCPIWSHRWRHLILPSLLDRNLSVLSPHVLVVVVSSCHRELLLLLLMLQSGRVWYSTLLSVEVASI